MNVSKKVNFAFFNFLFFTLVFHFFFSACQGDLKKKNLPKTIPSANQNWKEVVNMPSLTFANIYLENAVKILSNGEIITGLSAISNYYRTNPIAVDSIQVIKNIKANKKGIIEYEVSTFWSPNHVQYKQLIIWNVSESGKKRELEFIAKAQKSSPYLVEIAASRKHWIELCNQHNAQQLVNELYTENAIYYNHKPVLIGQKLIAEDYQYMNKQDYQLMLNPIIIEPVNSTLAFEIGQCSGTYNGKYVLIWQKQNDGTWQVLMDSNI